MLHRAWAAAARRFTDEGANVVVLDLDRAALEKANAKLPQDRLLIQPGDTTDMAAAAAAVKAAVDCFGGLDVLINNAGIFRAGTITETSEADFGGCWPPTSPAYSTWPRRRCPNW